MRWSPTGTSWDRRIAMTAKKVQASRREFIRRAAYVPPAILTLAAAPSYAQTGSANGPPPGPPKGAPKGAPKGKG
jgi:hypothetical protein